MSHSISAVILRGDFDAERAREFGMRIVPLPQGLSLIALSAKYCDSWAERLDVTGFVSERPLLNARVVHHMVNRIASEPLFAVIDTDYFGGAGDQSAAVYRGETQLMAPLVAEDGPINKALGMLGVAGTRNSDPFDAIGLGRYRDLSELFDDDPQSGA